MEKVITRITIETEVPKCQLTDENIERYKRNLHKTVQSNVDDNAVIELDVEVT